MFFKKITQKKGTKRFALSNCVLHQKMIIELHFNITNGLLLLVSVFGHQQYFRVRPQATVEVTEGSSIILHCSIGNQAGLVQWAKDGFVLGN